MIRAMAVVAVLVAAGQLARAQDTLPEPMRAERLRRTIEERFVERLTQDLALDQQQSAKVQDILGKWATRRWSIEREERRLRQTLASQMRPGVAADDAVVTRAMEGILDGRLAYVQSFKDELRELAPLLTPVQRAQYLVMRDRLAQRVQDIRSQRTPPGPPRMRRP